MNKVTIYTDGACRQNSTWQGGWGVVILNENGGIKAKLNGSEENTTNSRMEIQAVIEGLKYLTEPSEVKIISDSAYVCNTINGWLDMWQRKGILREKANVDQWLQFIELRKIHRVTAKHIRGHHGIYYNEICDSLATGAIRGEYVKGEHNE